jgi:integrase
MKAARRWVPWIGAYTGARVNEITPLAASDFVNRDGIWMIRIRGANNKTRTYREVPLAQPSYRGGTARLREVARNAVAVLASKRIDP